MLDGADLASSLKSFEDPLPESALRALATSSSFFVLHVGSSLNGFRVKRGWERGFRISVGRVQARSFRGLGFRV